MKPIVIFSVIGLCLAGCSKPATPPSIEEKVILKIFLSFIVAGEYDRVCQNGKMIGGDVTTPATSNYYGNSQILAARFGGLQHIRFPDKSPEELVERMIKVKQHAEKAMAEKLEEEGCDGSTGQGAAKALAYFTQTPPWVIYTRIDQQIEKEGGTIASMEEIEAAGQPVQPSAVQSIPSQPSQPPQPH